MLLLSLFIVVFLVCAFDTLIKILCLLTCCTILLTYLSHSS